MTNSAAETTLGVLSFVSNFLSILSPLPDTYRVHRQKHTGEMVVLPLVTMWMNNYFWLLYGYGSDNVFPLMAISVFGLIMSSLYVVCYIRWSKERAYIAKAISVTMLLIIPATVYVVLFAVGTIHQSKDDFKLVLGYATNIQNMFAFLAPLEKVKQVLITKSAAPIPVLMSAAIFVNCVLWMSSGVVKHDNFLIVPNVIGATLGAIQVVLYFIYRPTRYTIEAVDKLELPVDLEMYSTCDQISPHAASFRPLVSPMEPIRS